MTTEEDTEGICSPYALVLNFWKETIVVIRPLVKYRLIELLRACMMNNKSIQKDNKLKFKNKTVKMFLT